MKNRDSFRSLDIDNAFAQRFRSSKFYTEIYSKHKDEVIIGIRDGYICLYYNCDCIGKIKPGKVLKGEINGYFTDKQTDVMTEDSIINLYPLIKVQSDKRQKQEKQAQQQLYIQNNNNPNSNWFCIDVEFTKSLNGKKKAENWRFDLIAITKTKPYKVALIELKYGNKAISGKSGIRKHIKDFYEFYQNDNNGGFGFTTLKSEIIGIINALDKVGVSIPQGLKEISENDIESKPEFYFITLNNNPERIGGSNPKQSMSGYLFSDKRWGCKKISTSVTEDGDYYDITHKDREFSPIFLFSNRTLPNLGITDILEDKSYEKEYVYPNQKETKKMNITIYRGAAQIGGCITEISTDVAKVIIDLGSNLPGCKQEDFTKEEITEVVKGADAVLYTHYHGDHVGFISMVPEAVRQYIGAGAQDVLRCKYAVLNKKGEFQKEVDAIERMLNYEASIPLQFKDLKVTPFYCSHSAFDAYMFKIEWNGKVILHTGDFRKHGYMGNKLIPMLKKYVGQVDVLITEGTMLGRKDETVKTEYEIQKATKEILTSHKYVFALGSSTDIDRMASFHAACKATKRHFYVDQYQQSILDVFTKYTSSPLYDFSNSNGYQGTTFGLWEFCHIKKESVVKEMQRRGFLMPVRSSGEYLVKAMLDVYTDEEPILLYSMWDGYWKGTEEQRIPGVEAIRSLFKPENIIPMHTSGHADVCSLSEVCRTVNPKLAIIPIHKEKDSDFSSLPITEEQKSKVITSNVTIEGINIRIR